MEGLGGERWGFICNAGETVGSGGRVAEGKEGWDRWLKVRDVNMAKGDVTEEGRRASAGDFSCFAAVGDPGDNRFSLLLFSVRRRRWV